MDRTVMDVERIVRAVEEAGYQIRVSPEGGVQVRPTDLPLGLSASIQEHRKEVIEILLLRKRQGPEALDRLEELRRFAPVLFRTAILRGHGPVLVWGVSPHGVAVSLTPGKPLLTVDPCELSTTDDP